MKSKDVLPIIVLAAVSAVISVFVSGLVISTDENRSQKVEVVESISSSLERPPEQYFNSKSVNPTKTIIIGQDQSEQPFGSQ